MEISFTRNGANNHIISCRRLDGTVTWMQIDSFFIVHDLCHYAVESILELKNAFYGMLASGIAITDFELPKEKRMFNLTAEALLTEQIVNLLTIEYNQGPIENFLETLSKVCKKNKVPVPVKKLDKFYLQQIRQSVELLMNRWQLLPEGETITLIFKE